MQEGITHFEKYLHDGSREVKNTFVPFKRFIILFPCVVYSCKGEMPHQ